MRINKHNDFLHVSHLKESEDTKGVIRICKSKKDIQHNGQKKKDKSINKDLQNIENERSSNMNPTKKQGELRCSGRESSFSMNALSVQLFHRTLC